MTYRVQVTPTAAREFKRLDHQTRTRVRSALTGLADEPRPPGAKKLTGSKADWRLRVGDYRILYEVDDPAGTVMVWRITHRREAYR